MNILVTSGSLRFSVIATSTGYLSLENSSYALVASKEEECFYEKSFLDYSKDL
ncbi:MAG: hypothetical protein K0S91_2139 [Nitrososphaeraceae archaeon]|nr:hypothetical protein [Nitrososphaeraceae archaeon]